MAPRSVDVGVERTGSSTCTTSTNRHKPFFLCFFSFFVLSFLILLRGGVNVDGPTDNKDPLRYQLFYSFLESLLVSSLRIEGIYQTEGCFFFFNEKTMWNVCVFLLFLSPVLFYSPPIFVLNPRLSNYFF
jgi:hypothetical protein